MTFSCSYICTNNVKINIPVSSYDNCKFKKGNIVLIRNYECFQQFGLLKYIAVVFSCLGVFPASIIILLSSLQASWLKIFNVALLKWRSTFYGSQCSGMKSAGR